MKGTEMERTANVPEDLTGRPRRVATGGVSWRNTFSAFQYRNYRLYFCGQLVSLIGTWMTSTAQGWLVYQLTGSKALLGVVGAAGTAPMLVFAAWGGWAADRFPKRTVLLWTQSAMMILAFVFAGLVWLELIRPWEIIVLGLLGGVAMAFDMPARQSFVVEIASREDLMNAISLNSAMFNGARIVGPAIAGFLMAKVGIALCFLIDGVSFLAVLAGLLMMRLPPQARSAAMGGALRIRSGWSAAPTSTVPSWMMPSSAAPAAPSRRWAARLPNRSKVFATSGITPGSGLFLRSSRLSGFSGGRTRC